MHSILILSLIFQKGNSSNIELAVVSYNYNALLLTMETIDGLAFAQWKLPALACLKSVVL
jgi:hypothetical protein